MGERCRVYYLECVAKDYEWGKRKEGSVAQLLSQQHLGIVLEDKPYAELWLGDHPSGPSSILVDGKKELLSDHIKKNPKEILGDHVAAKYTSLPFLFKVLSINKPLSIQAHPDKHLAEQLSKKDPQNYKDPNHKPEMAIAINHMRALCGFRPLEEIAAFIQKVPELESIIGKSTCDNFIKVVHAKDASQEQKKKRTKKHV